MYQNSILLPDLHRYRMKHDNSYSTYFAALDGNFSIVYAESPCDSEFYGNNMMPVAVFASQTMSMTFFVGICIFFISCGLLRNDMIWKYWMTYSTFSICSLLTYFLGHFSVENYEAIRREFLNEQFYGSPKNVDEFLDGRCDGKIEVYYKVLAFFENFCYFWLLLICLEASGTQRYYRFFYSTLIDSIKKYFFSSIETRSDWKNWIRWHIQFLLCFTLSSLLVWFSTNHYSKFDITLTFYQRINPQPISSLIARQHIKSIGIYEVIVKCVALNVFIGIYIFIMWKGRRRPSDQDSSRFESQRTRFQRYEGTAYV